MQFNQTCPLCGTAGLSRLDKHIKLGFCLLLQQTESDSEREELRERALSEIAPASRLHGESRCKLCKSLLSRVESVLCERERENGRKEKASAVQVEIVL